MTLSTVTWRQAAASLAATVVALLAVFVVVRADGLPAVDAASARATGWFVHQPTGRVVLVDGYRGVALGGIQAAAPDEQLSVAEGSTGAYVLNDTTAEARAIDTVEMRLRTPFGLSALGEGPTIARVGQAGLVVVDPSTGDAAVVPVDGEPLPFDVDAGSQTEIGRDGAVWSVVGEDLVRTTSSSTSATPLGADGVALSMVGSEPLVVDAAGRRARLGSGSWQPLPTDAAPSEIVVQVPGPSHSCGWVAADDELWCVGHDGIEERSTIDGLDVDGSDRLAIAGDAGVVVRRGPSEVVQIDWRAGSMVEEVPLSMSSDAALSVTATVDLIWIDDRAGDMVWAVNPWSVEAIAKDAEGILVLGEDGSIVEEGTPGGAAGPDERSPEELENREPDDNGIDDPPVAVDDPVTARSRASVTVEVTANDYDPDGEAIAVSAVGVPGHGSVDLGTASTVVYTPEPGYVGIDRFEYTIVDGNGTEDTASVIIELLAPDGTNEPPVGVGDVAETGAGVPVVVDVLLNDIDPERDLLRIGGFSPPDTLDGGTIGEVTEVVGPSNLPALQFVPSEGFEGTAIFSYRPIDALGAIGADVEVRVEVANVSDPNRPPKLRPDAIRLRRNTVTNVPVLVNDVDPDGDDLELRVVEPLPLGLDVDVEGEELAVTARAGAGPLVPFEYEVEDAAGHVERTWVLVVVMDDVEPNRPPVVTPDTGKVVAGQSVELDVTVNDVDADGDPLTVIDVELLDDSGHQVVVFSRGSIQFTAADVDDDDRQTTARLTYTVTDGNGHEVVGDVAITVLPEALNEPPFARDDSTFTFVDVPVTIDVLRNDGDPSGGRPRFFGRPGCPSGGTATITTDNQIRFDPPRGLSGAFRCTYEVTNDSGAVVAASIIVSVRVPEPGNQAPVAVNDDLAVEVGRTASIDVTANDLDRDGDASKLKVVSSTAPAVGTAQRTGNVITYTATNQTGNATITYQVADELGAVTAGRLIVRIVPRANQAPIAVSDAQTVFAPSGPVQFSVLSNDSDPDGTAGGLSIESVSKVSGNGTVSVSGTLVTLTPDAGFLGALVASYTIADGRGETDSATVTLTVQEPPNRAPDARDDNVEVANGGTVTASVLFNDEDLDGDALTASIVAGPEPGLGTASLGANGAITFTGVPGASGTASIRYQISDGELTDTATLFVVVYPCAQSAPAAPGAFLRTGYQIPIGINLAAYAANGDVVDVAGPPGFDPATGLYTPPAGENGNVTINYSVVNSCRMRASGQVTIDVNQEPIAKPVTVQINRNASREVPVTDLASDAEPLRITGTTDAPSWVTTTASTVVLSPGVANPAGTTTFSVIVADPGGLATIVPVTVVVKNPPPGATPDTIDVSAGVPVTKDIVANDNDLLGLGLAIVSPPSPYTITFPNGETGVVVVNDDARSITVDPRTGTGTMSFTYTVRSLGGGEASATVTVIGPPPPPPPPTTPPPTTPPTTGPPTTTTPP